MQLVSAHISDFHFFRRLRFAHVAHLHHSAIQTNSCFRTRLIQLGVIRFRGDHIFHGAAGNRSWNQRPNQQPRNRCITVRKMKNIWVRLFVVPAPFTSAQLHTLEARIAKVVVVVAFDIAGQRRNRLDADAEKIMRLLLEKRQHVRADFNDLRQEVGIAHLPEPLLLLFRR